MITLCVILMICVFGKLIGVAIRLAWGFTKILFGFIFLPLVIVGLIFAGLATFALPILLLVGIYALIAPSAT